MNGKTEVNNKAEEEKDTNDNSSPMMNGTSSSSSTPAPSSGQVNVGVKRSSEDEDSNKPDLKKIRLVTTLNKDGFKVNKSCFSHDLLYTCKLGYL